jgi:anthranilate/para-aminobenzoate synthase component II
MWKLSAHEAVPVLGICLGFQSLCIAYGASMRRMPEPCHGHAKRINHCGEDIFFDIGEVVATNYNSLEVKLGQGSPLTEAIVTTASPRIYSSSSSSSIYEFDSNHAGTRFTASSANFPSLPELS